MGIEAALAGGMKAVGVATTHGAGVLAKAHRVVRRLDELSPAGLEALFA
jgi:beta-phosphoglucomutase-like phosphatase (HAD superfamily)